MILLLNLTFASDTDILFVGNSYTQSNQLHATVVELLEEGVWNDVESATLTGGGLKFTDHLQRSVNNSTWNQSLHSNYDWVFFQEQSQVPGFPATEQVWTDSRNAFVQLDDLVEAQGGSTFLFMTWGRKDGDSMNTWLYPDFETMQDLLIDGYLAYAAEASQANRPIYMANVGSAFAYMKIHHSELFEGLYSGDGSHPSYNGSYLAACVMYSSITGRSSLGMTAGAPDMAEIYQSASDAVVIEQPFGDFDYPWAWKELPLNGVIFGDGLRPLLKYDEESTIDVLLEDSRIWIEGGRIEGDLYVDGQSEAHLYEGVISGGIVGDIVMTGGQLASTHMEGNLLQHSGGEIIVSEHFTILGTAQLSEVKISLSESVNSGRLTASMLEASSLIVEEGCTLYNHQEEGYLEIVRDEQQNEEPSSENNNEPSSNDCTEPSTENETEPSAEPEAPIPDDNVEENSDDDQQDTSKTGCQMIERTDVGIIFTFSILGLLFRRRTKVDSLQ